MVSEKNSRHMQGSICNLKRETFMAESTATLLLFYVLSIAYGARNELIATADCACPGETFVYECSVVGGIFTVWRGSVFESGCEITLIHENYNDTGGSAADCNDGDVVGQSISVSHNCYRSSLSVEVSTGINGSTVECNIDDGVATRLINSATIQITTSPAPPPRSVNVTVNNQELNFIWLPIAYLCPSLSYRFSTSHTCGDCFHLTNSTTVSCSAFTASATPTTCEFTVHSVICGNISGDAQMTVINLQVPGAPVVHTVPQYLNGRTRSLTELTTTFKSGDPITISDDVDGSAINFTITYSDSTFGSVFSTVSISASSCTNRICRHTFNILESSSCPATTSIVTTVYAISVLGRGPSSAPVTRDGINSLVDVSFSREDSSIVCSFLNQPIATRKNCSANVTYGENCDQLLGVYNSTDNSGNTLRTPPLETRADVTNYCYVVTATSGNITVMVEGTLTDIHIIGSSSLNVAAIAAPVTIIIVVLVVLIAIVSLSAVLAKFCQNQEYVVKFSGKNEAGVLAKALKVFKDLSINVEVNTHLHNPEFDRKAEKGYIYSYIYCTVSMAEIDFLQNELKAEILGKPNGNGNEQACNITAVVRVKDRPGGLWEVLDKIGRRGINLSGVNTGEKCRSSTGFKDVHVKCSCSSTTVRKLKDCRADIGMTNVEIGLYTPKTGSQRAIEYLVRDQVGALAGTLELFTTLGLNINCVNVDHLRRANNKNHLMLNYIECSVDDKNLKTLKTTLKQEYGAIDVECVNDTLGQGTRDQCIQILKITTLNETGSLNRVLKAFSALDIELCGVNVLDQVDPIDRKIVYSHYHLEVFATKVQFADLRDALHSRELATDVKEFDIDKHCDKRKVPQHYRISVDHAEKAWQQGSKLDSMPRTMMIEFRVIRDDAGALAKAFVIFDELGINIFTINPAHMANHHRNECIECVCAKENRDALLKKIESHGDTKAKFLPDSEVPQDVNTKVPNYCVVNFPVGSNTTNIVEVLKAFPELGVEVTQVNPSYIKLLNQHVECCCDEDVREELLSKLGNIKGVIHVEHCSLSEEHGSEPRPDNYCVIQYSIHEEARVLVKTLKTFSDLRINIIGVNTLTPVFEQKETHTYKHNRVIYVGTDEQEKELRHKLVVDGLAIDVKPYELQTGDAEEVPDDLGENGIRLTGIKKSN